LAKACKLLNVNGEYIGRIVDILGEGTVIEYGQIVQYVFKVKNIGSEVLKITKTATSCGCTTVEIEKKSIEPGEEVNLKVEYNTGMMSGSHAKGRQERIIYVKSNDPASPQAEVVIKALVK